MPLILIVLLACSGKDEAEAPPAATRPAATEPASAPAAPAVEELGVIGIRNKDGQIKTILVDRTGFKTLGNGLAVPREGGWWWLGYIGQEGWEQLVLWSAPSGTPPAAPAIDLGGDDSAGLDTVVHYVGRDYVSFELHAGGMSPGAAHPWQLHQLVTTRIEAPLKVNDAATFTVASAPVDLGALGGEAASAALLAAGAAARASGECLGEPAADQWGLTRDRGAWAIRGGLSYEAEACRDSYAHYPTDVAVPAALLDGYPALEPPFETWAAQVPGLIDLTVSPSGELAVLFTEGGVKLQVGGERSDKQLYTKEPALVMAFWVSGDQAEAWRGAAASALPGGGRSRGGGGGFSIPGRKADFAKQVDARKAAAASGLTPEQK